jgi:hypothetical protein
MVFRAASAIAERTPQASTSGTTKDTKNTKEKGRTDALASW